MKLHAGLASHLGELLQLVLDRTGELEEAGSRAAGVTGPVAELLLEVVLAAGEVDLASDSLLDRIALLDSARKEPLLVFPVVCLGKLLGFGVQSLELLGVRDGEFGPLLSDAARNLGDVVLPVWAQEAALVGKEVLLEEEGVARKRPLRWVVILCAQLDQGLGHQVWLQRVVILTSQSFLLWLDSHSAWASDGPLHGDPAQFRRINCRRGRLLGAGVRILEERGRC